MVRAFEVRRVDVVLAVALAVALAVPTVALGRAGTPGDGGARGTVTAIRPFTFDLSAPGDFVAQTNFVQCVGASMQMMLNVIRAEDDQTAETQLELQELARSLSGHRPEGRDRKGASVRGWTAGLNTLGAGPYRTVGTVDLHAAIRLAARAMRETNRPVGLLVWRGRHAWVMAGFTATADPLLTDAFEVTQVTILDPLYPHGSKTWGPSPGPGEWLTVAELGRQFVPRGLRGSLPGSGADAEPTPGPSASPSPAVRWSQAFAGKYVIVMPATLVQHPRTFRTLR